MKEYKRPEMSLLPHGSSRRFTVTYSVGSNRYESNDRRGRMLYEIYDSPRDFLTSLKWRIIPQRLREATGLIDEKDLDTLLNSAGYRNSFIAEELLVMIDGCLDSRKFSLRQLLQIRDAFNGLCIPDSENECRIERFGSSAVRESTPEHSSVSLESPAAVYAC